VSEILDFSRSSGLANKSPPSELLEFANHVKKRILRKGEILYQKHDIVHSVFLVINGDFILDIEDAKSGMNTIPFSNSNSDMCYHLSTGSILGDEGLSGQRAGATYESTAVALTDKSIVFVATPGPSMNFLRKKADLVRYSALSYMDQSRWSAPILNAEQSNIYSHFNSLRRVVAYTNGDRGTTEKGFIPEHIIQKNIKILDKKKKIEILKQNKIKAQNKMGSISGNFEIKKKVRIIDRHNRLENRGRRCVMTVYLYEYTYEIICVCIVINLAIG
jgi:hypothetical protein